MAAKKFVGTEGVKWSTNANWTPSGAPIASSELTWEANKPCEQTSATAKAKQLDFTGYTSTFSGSNSGVLSIGTTSGTGLALKLVAGMTLTCESEVKFVSTSGTVEGITTAGRTLTFTRIEFNGTGGKWKLEDNLTHTGGGGMALLAGTLNLNAKTVTTSMFDVTNEGTRVLEMGGATIILTSSGTVWITNVTTGLTLKEASTSTIELTGNQGDFQGGGLTYGTVIFAPGALGVREQQITGSATFGTIRVNTAAKPGECKATLVGGSTTITITSGTLPSAGEEVRGTAIPAGTTIVKVISEVGKTYEMSAAATETVSIAGTIEILKIGLLLEESSTQTLTTLTTNGKSGELARLASTKKGKAAKVKSASVIETDWMILRDITFEGAGEWWAGANSIDAGGNTNIKFAAKEGEVKEVAATVKVKTTASSEPIQILTAGGAVRVRLKDSASVLQSLAAAGVTKVQIKTALAPSSVMEVAGSTTISTRAALNALNVMQAAATVRVRERTTAHVSIVEVGTRKIVLMIFDE